MNTDTPMVCTRCFTYNHEPYIKDALNGFAMQKTTFPVVTVVVDDASTDKTAEVIRQFINENCDQQAPEAYEKDTDYAWVLYAPLRTNPNNHFAIVYLKENHYSQKKTTLPYLAEWLNPAKYHALCEGDDYWTDPLKLQKQVDFLEANPEYGLCHTDFSIQDESGTNEKRKKCIYPSGDVLLNILGKKSPYTIGTCTTLYRKSIYDAIPKFWLGKNFKMGDAPLWIELSSKSKVKYLPDITAIYRRLSNSASHSSDIHKRIEFAKSGFDLGNFYCEIFNLPPHPIQRFYSKVVKIAFVEKNKEIANEYFQKLKSTGYKNVRLKDILFFWGTRNSGVRKLIDLLYKF